MNEWEWQLLEEKTPIDHLPIGGTEVKAGDRVRLRPKPGGDVLDIALAGQAATIERIEQDYEGKFHVSVLLDEDPGRDMGLLRQPGHRFFFSPDEVEPLPAAEAAQQRSEKPKILVAGIGNIFMGDDAFGVEVAKRLLAAGAPKGARVADFGIRGFDLTYAMQDGYETVILVDAHPRGQDPGTIYLVEPDLDSLDANGAETGVVETHGMNPMNVLRMAKAMNAQVRRVLLVGCEPADLGGEQGSMGLSEPVEAAVDEAVRLITSLIPEILNNAWPSAKV